MANPFVHVGNGNVLNAAEVEVVLQPRLPSTKMVVDKAKENGCYVHLNHGKTIRTVIVMKSGKVFPCMLRYDTLMNRLNGVTPITKAEEDRLEMEVDNVDGLLDAGVSDVPDAGAEDD